MCRRSRLLVVVALVALNACDRPDVIVLCHNANCAGALDASRDDTEEALRDSLALSYQGQPVIDGVELDLFWSRDRDACLFSHDERHLDDRLPATGAGEILAEHLRSAGAISRNGERFYVLLELKGFVDGSRNNHTAAEAAAHAECALDVLDLLRQGAVDGSRTLEVTFDTTEVRLLSALVTSPRWPGKQTGEQVSQRLSGDYSDPTSTGIIFTPSIAELTGAVDLDNVVVHSNWVNYGAYHSFRSLGLDITIWMFSANAEAFDAIERLDAEYVITNEAELMHRWLTY